MFNKPIDKMNFDELKNAVQILYDAFERQSREYSDLLQNLDFDNFTPEVKKAVNSTVSEETINGIKKTVIEQTSDAISTLAERQVNIKDAIEVLRVSQMSDTSKVYKICEYAENEDGEEVPVSTTYYY